MGTEIERKFLVQGKGWKRQAEVVHCRQGYLCLGSGVTVRVRVMDGKGFLTIKGGGRGMVRPEYEYSIPASEAGEMLDTLCERPLIEKKRYTLEYQGLEWVVDEFFGENRGLIMAEVELEHEDQPLQLPDWAGIEVTGDPRFFNVALVKKPFSRWKI